MLQEKYEGDSDAIECEFAIRLEGILYEGITHNVSMNGLSAEIHQGNLASIAVGSQGKCRLIKDGESVVVQGDVLATKDNLVVVKFVDLDFNQKLKLRSIVD